MKWLNSDEAQEFLSQYETEPQALVLFCDLNDLAGQLPAMPRVVSSGVPSPVNEWVGLVNARPV